MNLPDGYRHESGEIWCDCGEWVVDTPGRTAEEIASAVDAHDAAHYEDQAWADRMGVYALV